ncbi:MAG TPA: tyrosine-type recombinase/integrase, partial [Candidatus Dormibacteraeota bacterium]|nr:tyrosine-type recombinase/integrase [Candidatus Dormibacteraeota bacterium]
GPLFRRVDRWDRVHPKGLTPEAIALILKRALQRADLPVREFAGHSLRAGFATEAAAQGASERAIMRHGRWRSVTTVRRYIRSGELFTENPAAVLGL